MENQNITLHESDIKTLKEFAVAIANALAQKATNTDDIHQHTVALENELRRINQLDNMKPKIEYVRLSHNERALLKTAKRLKAARPELFPA